MSGIDHEDAVGHRSVAFDRVVLDAVNRVFPRIPCFAKEISGGNETIFCARCLFDDKWLIRRLPPTYWMSLFLVHGQKIYIRSKPRLNFDHRGRIRREAASALRTEIYNHEAAWAMIVVDTGFGTVDDID